MRDRETNDVESVPHLTLRLLLIPQAYQIHCHAFFEEGVGGPARARIGRVRGEHNHRCPLALKTQNCRRDRSGKPIHASSNHATATASFLLWACRSIFIWFD